MIAWFNVPAFVRLALGGKQPATRTEEELKERHSERLPQRNAQHVVQRAMAALREHKDGVIDTAQLESAKLAAAIQAQQIGGRSDQHLGLKVLQILPTIARKGLC
jgi:hypothetical protein